MPDVRTEGVAQSLMIGDWKMFVCRDKRHLGHGVRGFSWAQWHHFGHRWLILLFELVGLL